jgi:hypothetical protein
MHVFGLTLVQIHVLISVIYFLSFHFLSTKQVLKIILVLLFNMCDGLMGAKKKKRVSLSLYLL